MRILIHYRRRIEPWDFVETFDPTVLCKETYLLYEIRWTSSKIWRNSNRNTTHHAEVNFIEKHTSEGRIRPRTSCCITWFLSWSPCWECARVIKEFLSQHPRVTLVIYAARLFYHMDPQNRQGLRDLVASGVTIKIMGMAGNVNNEVMVMCFLVRRRHMVAWKSQKWKSKVGRNVPQTQLISPLLL